MPVASCNQPRIEADACLPQRGLVTFEALERVRMIVGTGDEGNPAMTQLNQVFDRKRSPVLVVNLQAEQSLRAQLAAGHDNRYVLGVTAQLRITQATGKHNDSIHAAADEFPHATVFVLIRPIAAHEEGRVAAMAQAGLDAPKAFTVERAVNRLGNHADGQRLAEREATGGGIRPEIKFRDGGIDGILQAIADV